MNRALFSFPCASAGKLLALGLAMAAFAYGERVSCRVTADAWVDAPPWGRAGVTPASDNHGADTQLVINGRNTFALLQFDVSAARALAVQRAVLRVHQAPGLTPITMVGISTISGSGPWSEGGQKNGPAEAGSVNYFFARAGGQPWAYPGSDLADVTFGLGGSLYAYRKASPARRWLV
jgi:hypothetical protein